jgi:hypothetical protein
MVVARLVVWRWFRANSFSLPAHYPVLRANRFARFMELKEKKKEIVSVPLYSLNHASTNAMTPLVNNTGF